MTATPSHEVAMLHTLPLLVAASTFTPSAQPSAVTFHVAPNGNDQWSGRSAMRTGDDGPFATIGRARDAVREYRKANGKAAEVTVVIADGRYELAEPLMFTPDDSGEAGRPTRFVAADGAKPVLSGGVRITGWKPSDNGVWTAPLPQGVPSGVRHIRVNGAMRFLPRLPKQGTYTIAGLAGADPKARYNTPGDKFEFKPGEIRADWKNLSDVEVVVLHFWVDTHFRIAAVDPEQNIVTFDRPSRRRLTETHGPQPARYYITNVAEALTEPGEFYIDAKAGTIAYIPTPGEDMKTAEVIVPRLPAVVRVEGKPSDGQFVQYIELRGLTFADSTWELPAKDAGDTQAASLAPGAVQLRGARHCTLEDCRVVNVAGYAFDIADGCRHNRIMYCEAADIGAGGVRMTGGADGSPMVQRTGENVITDNHLHRLGRLFPSGVGVLLMHADRNIVAHNHIHDLYYTGISVGWVWGYKPSVSVQNTIENNLIHDVGQKLLSDMGGIYMLGVSPGTVVRGNVIHDVDAYTYGGWGIYTDEGSTDILIEKNLVYRTKTGGFHQHYGQENIVRNNIFALAREDQIQRSRMEPHISFTFERNIVYYRTGVLLGKNWSDDKFILDHNVYWNAVGDPVTFPGGLTLEQWQARGFDKNSLIADPRFVNPEEGDFRLKDDSPALKLGFEPFDYTKAGVRKK
jgi:hypothetical protein